MLYICFNLLSIQRRWPWVSASVRRERWPICSASNIVLMCVSTASSPTTTRSVCGNQCIMYVDCIKRKKEKNNRPQCSLHATEQKPKYPKCHVYQRVLSVSTQNHSLHSSDQGSAVTDGLSSLFFSNKQLIKTLKIFIYQCKKKQSMISELYLAIHQGVIKMC